MIEWLREFWWALLLLVSVLGLTALAFAHDAGVRADWVEACVADGNKRYRCELDYDAAHRSDTTIVSVPR